MHPSPGRMILVLLMVGLISGCAALATQRMSDNLASTMLNHDDPETVRAAAPAYLLLLDSMIREQPDNDKLLMAGARLYGALAAALVQEPERIKRMSTHAREYAKQAFCRHYSAICASEEAPYQAFTQSLNSESPQQLDLLFVYASSWAGWIAAHSDDWSALADLPKVEALLQHLVTMDPGFERGRAQLYLAVMRSQLPQAMGGKPEQGRHHFELAIHHSQGRDLMAKVEYAQRYARLVFNQALHDRLLQEVLQAPTQARDLTLSNTLAKQRARQLLADDYF